VTSGAAAPAKLDVDRYDAKPDLDRYDAKLDVRVVVSVVVR
jgi:hypothetical protein